MEKVIIDPSAPDIQSREEKKVERLYQEIGQLQVELNWLKRTGFINYDETSNDRNW